ncbi:MAG TPA: M56 family metallopeptidase [Thermoanaerobaculia bacterium]|jgi:beta-lactamase regulating signal transducer with metallopeptidase domain
MSAMIMSWVVTYLMHSTLLIAAVWMGARFVRSAAVRDALWKLALTGAIVTSSLQLAMPVRLWKPAAPPLVVAAQPVVTTPGMTPEATPEMTTGNVETAKAPEQRREIPPQSLAIFVWSAIAAIFFARLLYGRQRLLAILRDRREIVTGRDRALLDELAGPRMVRLTESPSIHSPLAMVGWEVVVPGGIFPRLTDEQRRTILAHELAHLVRRDPLWLAAAEVLKALLFFQPLNFLAAAKMKETAEFLCDDAAVLQTGDRQALAETLAELASHVVPMPTSVAAMAEGGSNLIVRVTRVLRAGVPDLPLRKRMRLAIALVPLAIVAILAPGVAPALIPSLDGTANHFAEGNLVHTYQGKDGFTKIVMDAKNVAIAGDGSWVRFDNGAGFFRVRYTSERGAERRVDVLPGTNLAPVYRYSVGGIERPWSAEAMRLMIAAFSSKELEEIKLTDSARPKPEKRQEAKPQARLEVRPEARPEKKLSRWDATIEEEGTRDGVPLHFRLDIDSIYYDRATGAIDLQQSGSLFAEETLGDRVRTIEMKDGAVKLSGDWSGMSRAERQQWVGNLLRRHTTGDAPVVRAIQKMVP